MPEIVLAFGNGRQDVGPEAARLKVRFIRRPQAAKSVPSVANTWHAGGTVSWHQLFQSSSVAMRDQQHPPAVLSNAVVGRIHSQDL